MNETGIIMTPIGPAGDDLDVVMGANMARPQVDNQSSNKYQKLICSRALFWSIWGFPYFGQFRVPCIAPRLESAVTPVKQCSPITLNIHRPPPLNPYFGQFTASRLL